MSFASLSYKWMVVSKPYVWLRGTGTVNNVSGYEFLIAAVDGQLTGGGGADKFRIRIWKASDGTIIYDNMPNTALNSVAVETYVKPPFRKSASRSRPSSIAPAGALHAA